MKHIFLTLCILLAGVAHAQVGYQVSLLDSRTGEPRTNEKVSVTVKITDSKGAIVCSEQLTATSDAFGVLSLTVGNENTFANVNWQNLPLSISATVDGILIGSCNILNVPIAEHAKHTGVLTPEILAGKTASAYDEDGRLVYKYSFEKNGTAKYTYYYDPPETQSLSYTIDGNFVIVYNIYSTHLSQIIYYNPKTQKLQIIA